MFVMQARTSVWHCTSPVRSQLRSTAQEYARVLRRVECFCSRTECCVSEEPKWWSGLAPENFEIAFSALLEDADELVCCLYFC